MIPSPHALYDECRRLLGRETPPVPVPEAVPSAPDPSAAAPAAAAPPPTASGPATLTEYRLKGYHLDLRVLPAEVVPVARLMDQNGFSLDAVTGVDWIADQEMEVVYDYFHPEVSFRVVARVRVPRANPEVPTVREVFPGADWHERETHEFLGIRFVGHPNLIPLLLPEDATYHPLRKDFTA